jgi:hypothetical protein
MIGHRPTVRGIAPALSAFPIARGGTTLESAVGLPAIPDHAKAGYIPAALLQKPERGESAFSHDDQSHAMWAPETENGPQRNSSAILNRKNRPQSKQFSTNS